MKAKVEIFRAKDFETVLDSVASEYGHGVAWRKDGFRGGELHYHFIVKHVNNTDICVDVNSTILKDGLSAAAGENSIRAWLSNEDGAPLGNKVARWVTRLSGWQERLSDMLFILLSMGESIEYCTKCRSMEKIFIVKKEGPNHGRLFVKCNCPNSFSWLEETDQEEETKTVKADVKKAPSCPKCGARMVLRNRRDGSGQFWGCSLYPACKGACNVDDVEPEEKPVLPKKSTKKELTAKVQGLTAKDYEMDDDSFKAMKASQRFSPEEEAETRELQRRDREDEEHRCADKLAMEKVLSIDYAQVEQKVAALAVEKPKGFTPSKYHAPIFEWASTSEPGSAMVVKAGAGSGKTTTSAEVFKRLDPKLDIVFVVFNVHNVEPMKAKVPKYVRVCTINSLGNSACLAAYHHKDVIKNKSEIILKMVLDKMTYGGLYPTIIKLVSYVKNHLSGTTDEELNALADYHGVDLSGDVEIIFNAVRTVIERSKTMTDVIDFDDQCWLPVVNKLKVRKFDFIAIDEAQDTNKCQAAFLLMSRRAGGRVMAVGDEYQSMYGFRGADAYAIPNLIAALNASVMPLSITYRNPKSVVRLVNEEMPEITLEAADWADEGVVRHTTDTMALSEYTAGDMVVCRTNAPLVKPVFQLIRRGVKATIRGRDIGKGLLDLVKRIDSGDLKQLIVDLTEYKKEEYAKLVAADKASQAMSLEDKVDTIVALCDGCDSIFELEVRINNIFSDKVEGVVFSSIHRVKGLEAGRVFILRPDLLPHPMATKDWEKVQERNIRYVAYTRAMQELVFVDGGR